MITPELIGYIRGELAKGRTREEIRAELAKSGGWGEADLSEAFRTVIPMQSPAQSSIQSPSILKNQTSTKFSFSLWKIFLFIFLVALLFAVWFYRTPLLGFWNSGINSVKEFSSNYFNKKAVTNTDGPMVTENNIVTENTNVVKDCGVGAAPNLKNSATYENNSVLNCLGESAFYCVNAKGMLKDPLFPSVFQIIKDQGVGQNTCQFRLSYADDSALVDITGKKLAGQYISCPISSVKSLDESNPKSPVFKAPSFDNLDKYASQIYFYGTLGVFMEYDVDQNKIQNSGCRGDYIASVVASYNR